MAAEREELLLTVPADLTRRCQGIALDMGGSILKFVYRTKEDVDRAESEDSKYSQLHLVSFSRNELHEGLEYIKQRAFIRVDKENTEPPTVYTSGVGCTEYGKLICEALNIRLQNLTEFDCFVESFVYLTARLPRCHLLEPFNVDALCEPIEFTKSQLSAMMMAQSKNLTQSFDVVSTVEQNLFTSTGRSPADEAGRVDSPLAEAEPDTFPCLLVMIGSGIGIMKIEKDGTFKVVDGSSRGGKAFFGVGSLLTGSKHFNELLELASSGNHHNVDQFSNELVESQFVDEADDSLYKMMESVKPSLIYSFGKVARNPGQGGFSREDLARAWLNYFVLDITQSIHTTCLLHNIRKAFFCGGFCSHPFVREILSTELARRNLFWSFIMQTGTPVVFDFVKPGKHLGSLGCMIHGLEKALGE